MPFDLDERLSRDCFELGRLDFCRLLLMNNAAVPWLVLVPETNVTEICDLSADEQALLWSEVNRVAAYVRSDFSVDKLNIGAIGNIVSQLHVHVVGRRQDDYCWPGVVWGSQWEQKYTESEVTQLRDTMAATLKELTD
jgi:diadenosine tetraphosphate (Ap4A) HIT family hydrolase